MYGSNDIHRPQNIQDMQEIKTKKSHYLLIVMLSPQNISQTLSLTAFPLATAETKGLVMSKMVPYS